MKLNLLVIFVLLGQLLSAQIFTEVQDIPFNGVSNSSIAFADVDGDNDQDVLITGEKSISAGVSKLYTNDGMGNFTEVQGTPFDNISRGSIAFSDVDGDSDQDVLITGYSSGNPISKLYTNDGMGNFTEVLGTPFVSVSESSIVFSDVDGDSDQDVLITGKPSAGDRISKLYTNDGMGNFTEVQGTPFEGVSLSSITFSDIDGDSDQDVLITGKNNSSTVITRLYANDGVGNFTEVTGTSFVGFNRSSIAFSDIDGDTDQDLLITGWSSGVGKSKLYSNDGLGNFTEVQGTPFVGVEESSIAFSDVDGDNDQDVFITGSNGSVNRIAKLYTNDGSGNFTEEQSALFEGVHLSSIAFADIDGDTDQDILITGRNSSFSRISKLYKNQNIISSIETVDGELNFDFTLYPNPTKAERLTISYDSKINGLVRFKIFDLEGRLLQQHQENVGMTKEIFSINISSLKNGFYFIQLDDGLTTGIKKFEVH